MLPLGIRQRLSLAVAIVHEPEMLILDEPTSGVDPLARDRFWELLIDLSRNQGVTIFVSTHFMNEAERCDRISLMDSGTRAGDRYARRPDQGARRRDTRRRVHRLSRRGERAPRRRPASRNRGRRSIASQGSDARTRPTAPSSQPSAALCLHDPRIAGTLARSDPARLSRCSARPF